MNHFRRTVKAYAGAILAGFSALIMAQVAGTTPDAGVMDAFHIGIKEVAGAGVLALMSYAGIYQAPKNEG